MKYRSQEGTLSISEGFEFERYELFFAAGIFVWVGKKATQQERAEAMSNGQGFAKKKGYPPNTNVTRVLDGGEPAEFKSLFRDWKVRDQSVGFGRQASGWETFKNWARTENELIHFCV